MAGHYLYEQHAQGYPLTPLPLPIPPEQQAFFPHQLHAQAFQQHAHQPYPPVYAPQLEELRTVFITGFPPDVQPRELQNLLRFLPGYEASQITWKQGAQGSSAQGFALFSHHAAARVAQDKVHNLVFDDGAVLRCEIAHKNMYVREERPGAVKRSRYSTGGVETPAGGAAAHPGYAFVPSPSHPGASGPYYTPSPMAASPGRLMPSPGPSPARGYVQVTNLKDNPPCNTLFIGNLGDGVSEPELCALFAGQPGYRQLKLVRGARSVTCFVEFADVAHAAAVHAQHQGAVLASSDRGGIRIQFSKNPFGAPGKKRDAGGNWVGAEGGPGGPPGAATPPHYPASHASGPGPPVPKRKDRASTPAAIQQGSASGHVLLQEEPEEPEEGAAGGGEGSTAMAEDTAVR